MLSKLILKAKKLKDIPQDLDIFKDRLLFRKEHEKDRRIIDMETLEVWETMAECARHFNVSSTCVYNQIIRDGRTKGHKLEYFNYWVGLEPYQKEKYSKKNNVYFL